MDEVQAQHSVSTRFGWRAGYLFASFGLYMVDQSSKAWAVRALRFGHDRTIINGFLDLVYAENRGIAFGQLQEGGSFGRWFFVVLAVAAAIAVFYYFLRTLRNDDRVLGACALLLAGILGNHAGSYHWPTFNVADASICIGALLLACDLVISGRKTKTVVNGS
jgi:signal peptidase II